MYLESTTKVHRRNVRFYSSHYLFSNGFKFTIGFVSLHVSPTYSMVDLKYIYLKKKKKKKEEGMDEVLS
jgi:hypothetical protein